MIILGLSDMINAGAAILVDGRIAAAISEERLNRMKLTVGYPRRSIAAVMEEAGVRASDITAVAVAQQHGYFYPECQPCPGWLEMRPGGGRSRLMSLGSTLSPVVGRVDAASKIYSYAKKFATRGRPRQFLDALKRDFDIAAPARFYEHHYVHACCAYYTSGYDEALVVTMDGGGDSHSSNVYSARGGSLERLAAVGSLHSIGNYYSYITNICGFKTHRHEGKITGLAAYGEPRYLDTLRQFIHYRDGRIENVAGVAFDAAVEKLRAALPKDFAMADLAASIQVLLEEVVCGYVRYWLARTGHRRLAVAGGVFGNVKLNQRLAEMPEVETLFVHPAMDDGGLPLGAALAYQHELEPFQGGGRRLDDVYLGPDFDADRIESAIRQTGLDYRRSPRIADDVAALLEAGHVVCRFHGRMEFGPRALGNRSILYRTDDPSVNKWLNAHLKRTEFMPFAPSTLAHHARDCYAGFEKAADSARFMTVTFDCTETMRRQSPGVVHVDGTARPQIVDAETSPDFHAILTAYHARTGNPSLINTSFNIHEEPIVCTPEDALRALVDSGIAYLALGDFIVEGREAALRQPEEALLDATHQA